MSVVRIDVLALTRFFDSHLDGDDADAARRTGDENVQVLTASSEVFEPTLAGTLQGRIACHDGRRSIYSWYVGWPEDSPVLQAYRVLCQRPSFLLTNRSVTMKLSSHVTPGGGHQCRGDFWAWLVTIRVFSSPTSYMLWSFGFFKKIIWGLFHRFLWDDQWFSWILNFNQLVLNLHLFMSN